MASLETNLKQVNANLVDIKDAIINSGVEIPEGTPMNKYADKIKEVSRVAGHEQWSDAWDLMQNKGKRDNYTYAFYACSTLGDSFYPKYDFNFTNASYFMRDTGGKGFSNKLLNLPERLAECGVKMDFSNCTNLTYTFYSSCISHIPEIDCRNAGQTQSNLLISQKTITVDKLILKEDGSQYLSNTFGYGYDLENIVIEGKICGNNSGVAFNAKWSKKLSKASIINLITALADDKSGTATFSTTAVNKAFETADGLKDGSSSTEWQTLLATKPTWTISLTEA